MLTTENADSAPETTQLSNTGAVARLLELAARNADELLAESKAAAAQAEADQVTASARAEADQLLAEARTESERVHAELEKSRTDQIAELNRHRTTVLSEVKARQTALESEVRRLEQLDADHRDRMRSYLTQQLEQLEPQADAG